MAVLTHTVHAVGIVADTITAADDLPRLIKKRIAAARFVHRLVSQQDIRNIIIILTFIFLGEQILACRVNVRPAAAQTYWRYAVHKVTCACVLTGNDHLAGLVHIAIVRFGGVVDHGQTVVEIPRPIIVLEGDHGFAGFIHIAVSVCFSVANFGEAVMEIGDSVASVYWFQLLR